LVVIIPKKAYLTIVAACVRFANVKIRKEDWIEVHGVFLGKNVGKKNKKDVIISAAFPIMHEKFDPEQVVDRYEFSEEDYVNLALIEEKGFETDEFVVGWWHSHPGFKVMLSGLGDRKTTLYWQSINPFAIALVFNPDRLTRQIELPFKKGDPIIQLKNDPGFKIFRLDDSNDSKSNFHEVEYKIEGYESIEQLVTLTQKFIIDVTNFFPAENIPETYERFINEQITKYNSLLLGTEEYLTTLVHKGQSERIPVVLETQSQDIRKFVVNAFGKIDTIKELLDYLEYKERATIIPKVDEILNKWNETVSGLDKKLKELSKKF
jgi:proteasome lid subunit RPN8/RPN11